MIITVSLVFIRNCVTLPVTLLCVRPQQLSQSHQDTHITLTHITLDNIYIISTFTNIWPFAFLQNGPIKNLLFPDLNFKKDVQILIEVPLQLKTFHKNVNLSSVNSSTSWFSTIIPDHRPPDLLQCECLQSKDQYQVLMRKGKVTANYVIFLMDSSNPTFITRENSSCCWQLIDF